MAIKTIAIAPDHIFSITKSSGVFTSVADPFSINIRQGSRSYEGDDGGTVAIYQWNPADISALPAGINVTDLELVFWAHGDSNANTIDLGRIDPIAPAPIDDTLENVWNEAILFKNYGTASTLFVEKSVYSVDLDGIPHFNTAIADKTGFAISMRRQRSGPIPGSIDVGGSSLALGSNWEEVSANGIATPPLLYITFVPLLEDFPDIVMRYTTEEPEITQLSPQNSIGGYRSANAIFPRSRIRDCINSSQTTIQVDVVPSRVGLASIGPEIIKYTGIDVENRLLTGVTRAVAPIVSFPACFDGHQNQEFIYYLHPDKVDDELQGTTDLDRLFDTTPTGTTQYRCVSFLHTGNTDIVVNNITVHLVQNSNSDVQIDIGIEVPAFDSYLGNHDGEKSTGTIFTDSSFVSFATGFFTDAFIRFPDLGRSAKVDTFDAGEFILTSSVGTIANGESFRIYPAPGQRLLNDISAPNDSSGLFSGFFGDGGSNTVNLVDQGTVLRKFDLFYVWIKRTLKENVSKGERTGAVIVLQYTSADGGT